MEGLNITPDTFRTKTGQLSSKSGHRQKSSNLLKNHDFFEVFDKAEGWYAYKELEQQF